MKRCPKCGRFGAEYDSYTGTERCLWNDCLWVNTKGIDLDNQKFKLKFTKFIEAVKIKKTICGAKVQEK